MFKNILCPVDFSEASGHAVRYASALARIGRGRLIALHVAPPLLVTPALPPSGSGSRAVDDARLLAAEVAALFEDVTRLGVRVDALVERGHPAEEILKQAAALPADVIVMGTHGAGGFEYLMLGSVAEKVVRKATCPVITVPPLAQFTPERPFKKLVCAVDFSEWSLAALDEACAIASETHGSVTAVHVIEWPWHETPSADVEGIPPAQAEALLEYRRYLETTARARLDAAVREVCRDRCPVEVKVVNGKAYREVLCVAERERADLVALGVHARNALDVFVFGSTTHQVVRRAPCPVLTLRH